MKILVADDDPEIRTTYKFLLESHNHEVQFAFDGEECLGIYNVFTADNKNFFDMVIVDYEMPKKNGLQCIDEISKINPIQKMLLVTAFPTSDIKFKINLLNIKVLEKPFSSDELLSALNSL